MAEVSFEIKAVDATSSVVEDVKSALASLAGSVSEANGAFTSGIEAMAEQAGRLEEGLALVLSIATEGAVSALGSVEDAVGGMSLEKVLSLDVSDALSGAESVVAAIDSIPDVTYKSVVVQYQTQASPVMGFSEGMEYIKKRMESLPTEGAYKVKYDGVPEPGTAGAVSAFRHGDTYDNRSTAFSAGITVNLGGVGGQSGRSGGRIAREVDRALADLWRYNRSALRRATGS